ncbi:DUF2934 domain-containing protein, partial [Mesorhizobium sp. M4B.F.Ca.ET.013.02.1.1]|uniref:DUF2934 domain-containing protein n=1 Tax=Mesorhizobium sp. M4B.F.Ca.ET.013.02.1.1 TaxID=2496755 RepID=UPI0032AF1D1C
MFTVDHRNGTQPRRQQVTDDRQERIRQRAHAIWEKAGRPEGADIQHWDQATAEI